MRARVDVRLRAGPIREAVTSTTGVSSTTVASKLSTAVIADASPNTPVSSRPGEPADRRASQAPQAWNSPSTSQKCASTSTAARNPTTGPNRSASAQAWSGEIAPVTTASPAAGTATAASGQPKGRRTAHTSTATSRATDRASASGVFRAIPSGREQIVPGHEIRPG